MKTCGMCEATGIIYAGTFQTWEGPVNHYQICEACGGSGFEAEEVTSEDWAEYAAMMQAEADADFLEACAGLDSWYRAQGWTA